jgi:hypothetical protein
MNMANDIVNDIAQQPWPSTSTYTPLGVHLSFGQRARTIRLRVTATDRNATGPSRSAKSEVVN